MTRDKSSPRPRPSGSLALLDTEYGTQVRVNSRPWGLDGRRAPNSRSCGRKRPGSEPIGRYRRQAVQE